MTELRQQRSSIADRLSDALTVHTCRALVARDVDQRPRQIGQGRRLLQQAIGLARSGGRIVARLGVRCTQQLSHGFGYVLGPCGSAPFRAVGKRELQLVESGTSQPVTPFAPPALPGFITTTR